MRGGLVALLMALSVAAGHAQSAGDRAPPSSRDLPTWSGPWIGAVVGAGVMPTFPNTLVGLPSSHHALMSGGGIAGADIQSGRFVIGLSAALLAHSDRRSGLSIEAGARAGYLISPAALVFATAGVSTARNRLFVELPGLLPLPARVELASQQTYGFFLGGGVEYRLTGNWSVAGEYVYADSGSVSFKGRFVTNGFADRFEGTQALRMQSLRFSLRHRF